MFHVYLTYEKLFKNSYNTAVAPMTEDEYDKSERVLQISSQYN